MKKILSLIVYIFLLIGMISVSAQEETETSEDTDKGVTPDSALYGLDRAAERISLLLTFNKASKAKKGLEHAQERVLEAKKLVKLNKFEHLERLKEEHKKDLEKVKLNLEKISEENPEQALDNELLIETEIENQENQLDEVSTNLDLKTVSKLNEEQVTKLKAFLESIDKDISDVRIKLNNDQTKVKLRLKSELKRSDKEVEDKLKELKEKHKLTQTKEEVALKAVERLENKVAKLKEISQKHKERGKDVTELEERLKEVESILTEIKAKLESKDLENIRELIKKANQLLNFRDVFRAVEDNNESKLKELKTLRLEKAKEIRADLKELKAVKENIKEAREDKLAEREAKKVEGITKESTEIKVEEKAETKETTENSRENTKTTE